MRPGFAQRIARRSIAPLSIALVLAAGGAEAAAGNASPDRTLLWSDEFSGPRGAAPNPVNWRINIGADYGNGDDRVAYTNRPANVSLDGHGNLALTVRRETYTIGGVTRAYTSGRINTSGLRDVGAPMLIEARIKVPTDPGLVPAFWTLGANYSEGSGPTTWPDCGEIDILEATNANPNRALYHLHGPDATAPLDQTANQDISLGTGYTTRADLSLAHHTYGIAVYPDRVEFRFDGLTRRIVTKAQYERAGGRWTSVFDLAHYLVLNVGSLHSWVGDPVFTGSRSMLIDWVRVYRIS